MVCCLCGETFRPADEILRTTPHTVVVGPKSGVVLTLTSSEFEDGTKEKLSHVMCVLTYGRQPLAIIGADREGIDG